MAKAKKIGERRTLTGTIDVVDNRGQQERALDVVNALHLAGFTQCYLKSVVMFSGGRMGGDGSKQVSFMSLLVVVDEKEIVGDRFAALSQVAIEHGCSLRLENLAHDGSMSRMALWAKDDV